jgi:uncharacterized protein (TIGR02145 family)
MKFLKFNILALVLTSLLFSCKTEDTLEIEPEFGQLTDRDGNIYTTVLIGDQWWMAENLRSRTLEDGSIIQYISPNDSNSHWASSQIPLCTSIYDGQNGLLYNGNVVTSEQNIAPDGWHIATESDWKKLELTIGMHSTEIEALGWRGNETANAITSKYSQGWPSGITLFGMNTYGFNALPTGCRIPDGRTNIFNNTAFWWSKQTANENKLYYRYIDAQQTKIFRQAESTLYGMAIRCVKN